MNIFETKTDLLHKLVPMLALICVFLVLSSNPNLCAAESSNFGFTSAGLSVNRIWVDDGEFDFNYNTYGVGGSMAVSDNAFLVAGLLQGEINGGEDQVDITSFNIGFGGNSEISTNTQIVLAVRWVEVEWELNLTGGTMEAEGLGADIGFKRLINPELELVFGVQFDTVGDDDTTTAFFGAEAIVDNGWAVGLTGFVEDDSQRLQWDLKKYF